MVRVRKGYSLEYMNPNMYIDSGSREDHERIRIGREEGRVTGWILKCIRIRIAQSTMVNEWEFIPSYFYLT